jgi:HK97 family phage portal protein
MAQLTTKQPGLPALIYQSIKAAFQMRFSGFGGSAYSSSNWWTAGLFNNSRVNYAQEAGDLVQSSLVMSAVNWLGRVLPEAPLQVMRADKKGKEEPVIGHPAIALLKRPNPFYSGATLWKTFALSWISEGNPYFLKVRNGFGEVIQLWYVPPSMITPRWPEDGSDFISYYEYQADGRTYKIEVDSILHFRDGADPKNMGRTGLSPVASVLREICADNEVPAFHFLLLKAGGVPPVVLSLKDGQSGTQFDPAEIKAKYIAATTGDQRGKVFVSGNAVELTKVGFSPAEMDLKVLRHLPESRFASVIGIAKETLGFGAADEGSTYNNVQQADERSISSYVRPLWSYIEDELTHQLGPDFGLADNERFAFDLTQIAALQEDQDLLHKRAALDLASGGITVNEYREMLNLPPVDDGNVYLRSSSIQAVTPEMVSKAIQDALNPPEPVIQPLQLPQGEPQPKQLVNGKHHTN